MDYCHLRKEFPETISMDQLYRICHISKRKAHWLLENGIIPCRDSGKHTRRFSIPLEEVIRFLELRDTGVLEEVIPHGAFSGGSSRPVCPARRELDEDRLCAYLLECWQDWPDMLTTRQTAELFGYSLTSLNRWWSRGQVKGVKYRNELLYSKESLACWLASVKGQNIAALSKQHREWMKEFQREKQDGNLSLDPVLRSLRNRKIFRRIKRPPSQRTGNEMAVGIFIMV